MSVLYCQIPNFLLNLTYRHSPALADRPLALLGTDERVWAVSPQAAHTGVQTQMTPRQAQLRCPGLLLHPLDVATCQAEQQAFTDLLTTWQLPVEEAGWGRAYLDLHTVAKDSKRVKPLASELGQHLRTTFGEPLQPALGWDSGKFTARAAAHTTQPGRIKLVSMSDEVPFLSPLPITLLPLPALALQQLTWLGIHTLGQFGALPSQAVWQRWGQPGKLAHQWAKGHDDRPVRSTVRPTAPPLRVEIDPPTEMLTFVLHALLDALNPLLRSLAERFEGIRQLQITLSFVEGSKRLLTLNFAEPIHQEKRLAHTLTTQFQLLNWPGELSRVEIAHPATGELLPEQLTLFPELDTRPADPSPAFLQRLTHRYGDLFYKAILTDPHHPIAERRFVYQAFI